MIKGIQPQIVPVVEHSVNIHKLLFMYNAEHLCEIGIRPHWIMRNGNGRSHFT